MKRWHDSIERFNAPPPRRFDACGWENRPIWLPPAWMWPGPRPLRFLVEVHTEIEA